jgi:signal transduction histidine kinase
MSKRKAFFDGIHQKTKISLIVGSLIMLSFFVVQSLAVFGVIQNSYGVVLFGYACILGFIPPFIIVTKDFLENKIQVIRELKQKNTYLEHAAKILRHDMHSGINTYIPRGIRSLERRLGEDKIRDLKIESPVKMIKEGLKHTQKVYNGVYEFTNLVKKDSILNLEEKNIKSVLHEYLELTSYKSQVIINDNMDFSHQINESLFCTAIDNLIRNGLKYNDSSTKYIKIYKEGNYICVEDNGRGMSQKDFEYLSQPYTRATGQKEQGTGLGLNICKSILEEHGFSIRVEKKESGIMDFYTELSKIEGYYNENPDAYVFDRKDIEKAAQKDEYSGKIRMQRGGRDKSRIYVIYDKDKESNKGTKIKIKLKK